MNLFNIERKDRKVFARHFLKEVAVFVDIVDFSFSSIYAKREEIKAKFTDKGYEIAVMQHKEVSVNISGEDVSGVTTISPVNKGLLIKKKDSSSEIQLIENKIILIERDYISFEILEATIKELLSYLKELGLVVEQYNSLAIRKINSFIIDPVDDYKEALDILNPCYFSMIRSGLPKGHTVQANEDILALEIDGFSSVIKSSFLKRKDSDTAYQVDLEFFLNRIFNTDLNVDEKAFFEELKTLNDEHYNIFMWSIDLKMQEIMSGEENV